MMSSVIADCPDNRVPNSLDKSTPVVVIITIWSNVHSRLDVHLGFAL